MGKIVDGICTGDGNGIYFPTKEEEGRYYDFRLSDIKVLTEEEKAKELPCDEDLLDNYSNYIEKENARNKSIKIRELNSQLSIKDRVVFNIIEFLESLMSENKRKTWQQLKRIYT